MKKRSAIRITAVVGLIAALALGSTFLFRSGSSADAQLEDAVAVTVSSHDLAPGESAVTATIAVSPGTTQMSSLSMTVDYDRAALRMNTCTATAGVGLAMCHESDALRVAVAETRPITVDFDAVSIEFSVLDATADTTVSIVDLQAFDGAGADLKTAHVAGVITTQTGVAVATGSIAGHVVDDQGSDAMGIEVCALASSDATTCVTTDAWGNYNIADLVTGTYTVTFTHPTNSFDPMTTSADVTSPETTSGIDAVLGRGVVEPDVSIDTGAGTQPDLVAGFGAVTGFVVDVETGNPVRGAEVCAASGLTGVSQGCALTNADGSYAINNLTTGNYALTVTDPGGRYNDAPADVVGVNEGQVSEMTVTLRPSV